MLALGCGKSGDSNAPPTSHGPPVLSKLGAFKPVGDETYDKVAKMNELKATAKKANQEPPSFTKYAYDLPPTPADTLASDVRLLAFYDFAKPKLDAKTITAEPVKQVLDFYTKASAGDLRGLRPATHQAFVKSLADAERGALADELVAHIKTNGFKGADKLDGAPPPQPSEGAKLVLGVTAKPADAAPPTPAVAVPVYAGKYKTTEGAMTLYQRKDNPNQVDGVYAKGQLACNATGDHLDCAWMEPGAKGRAQFTRDVIGNMKGTWGAGKADRGGGSWSCTLVSPGVIE